MKGTVIVDGNSVCHAADFASKLTVGQMQTQAIFGMIKSMRVILGKYPGWNILTLWDGSAQWRKDIYPEYKANRAAMNEKQLAEKEAYKAQSPFVRKSLSLLGINQMLVTTREADDMAGLISTRLSAAGVPVELVSGDKDWLQLINEHVSWFDPILDRNVNLNNFFKFTGYFSTAAFVEGKALVGDLSDNIPGAGGIGEKGAPEFIAEFGSVENFYKMVEEGTFIPKKLAHIRLCGNSPYTKDEWREKFEGDHEDTKALNKHMKNWEGQGRRNFARNMKLMNLKDVPAPESKDISIIKPDYDEARFRLLCEKLAFTSILRNFDNFVAPFRAHISH